MGQLLGPTPKFQLGWNCQKQGDNQWDHYRKDIGKKHRWTVGGVSKRPRAVRSTSGHEMDFSYKMKSIEGQVVKLASLEFVVLSATWQAPLEKPSTA
jgi:hypothetical protein